MIVPLTEEALFKVKVDPVFRTTLPVIALEAAKAKAPEDPPPTVTVEALIDSLAVMLAESAILRAASPLVEPKLFPEAIVLVAVRFTVPVLAAEPSTDPVRVPDPKFRIEDEPIATAPVMFPDVVVRVEDAPSVIAVASRLFDPAVRVLEAANVIEDRELAEVPTLPARVLLSEKAAVPTPSVAP